MMQDVKNITWAVPLIYRFSNKTKAQFDSEMRNYQKTIMVYNCHRPRRWNSFPIDTNPSISQRKYPSPQEIYNTQGLTGIQRRSNSS